MSINLSIDRFFNTTPEKLYEVWTNEQYLSQWFGVKIEAEPKVGGHILIHFGEDGGPIKGKYLSLNPYESLSFTWTHEREGIKLNTCVYVTFQKEIDGTRMTLRHEGFLNQDSFDAHDKGWLEYMELWVVRTNTGPADTKKSSISEVLDSNLDFLKVLSNIFKKSISEFKVIESPDGVRVIEGDELSVRIAPCRFGQNVALSEWGFENEAQRLASRQKWVAEFAKLRQISS